MPIESIGMIGTKPGSETVRTEGPVIDPGYTRRFARAHEDAGFDRILIGYGSGYPEGSQAPSASSTSSFPANRTWRRPTASPSVFCPCFDRPRVRPRSWCR